MTAMEKLIKARTRLLMGDRHYFWGILAMRLNLVEDPSKETAATDGESLRFNPEFITSLSMNETVGLIAHEVEHCARGHIWRGKGLEHDQFNVTADLAINMDLLDLGLCLPKGALVDQAYKGMSVEEIYAKWPSNPPKGNENNDPGRCGAVTQSPTEEKAKEMQAQWKVSVTQAIQAVGIGNVPGCFGIYIKEVLDPPLPWYTLLRDFVERCAKNDYCWSIPNRRYLTAGVFLPSFCSEVLSEVIIAIDSSGSTQLLLERFGNEVSAVLGAYKTRIRVIWCDSEVQAEEEYATEDLPLKLVAKGGGGTDFRPVFDYIEMKGYNPACLIYLTDMYGYFPTQAPSYPVLWVSPNKTKAPFGDVVLFNS